VLLDLIRGGMPPPWNDQAVEAIAQSVSIAAIESFFGELVLFAGEEARRLARVAAGRPLASANGGVVQ
jgi:hypothetical protein